jgi:hypothetical protein
MKVTVLEDAIAGVDVTPGDAARARDEMRAHGAELVAPRSLQEGGDLTAPIV